MTKRFIFVFFSAAFLLQGCKNPQKEAVDALAAALNPPPVAQRPDEPAAALPRGPVEFVLKAVADPVLNRDGNGRPLSVVVRVFQLRAKTEFSHLSFEAAASRSDAELFPKELAAASELVLKPGNSVQLVDKLLPETQYVGVVAYFRQPDARMWRFMVDAHAVRKEGLSFVVQDCYFALVTPGYKPLPGQDPRRRLACNGFTRFSSFGD